MRQRNKLYTVNRWNQPAFMSKENLFFDGGQSSYSLPPLEGYLPQGLSNDTYRKLAIGSAGQMQNAFHNYSQSVVSNFGKGALTQNNSPFQNTSMLNTDSNTFFNAVNTAGTLGSAAREKGTSLFSKGAWQSGGAGWAAAGAAAGALGSINTGERRGMWDTLDPVHHIAGGRESKVGNAMGDAGVALTQAGLSSGQPWLALAGAGLKVVGGLTNAAFGVKTDKERLEGVNKGIDANRNFTSNATSFDDIKGPTAVLTNTNVYKGGWFSGGKARRMNEELKERMITARDWANRSVGNNIYNLVDDQQNDLLANYAAYGGPLSFGLGGVLFEDGGNTVHQTATRSDMDEEPEYTPGENAGTNYHKYWMSGRQQQMQENMNSSGYSGTAAEETEKQMNNISAHKERYSDPNNPDDAHMYNPIGFTTIMGQSRSTRDEEGNLQAGDIVYNDVYKIYGGVPDDVIVHERTHAMNLNPWKNSPQESKVDAILREKYGDDVQPAGKYYLRPSEVYAGLMQQRYQLNLSPDYQVTPEDIVKWRDNGMLNEYLRDKDDDMLLRLFNEVAYEPMNNQNNVNYAAYGGPMNLGINSGALGLMQQNRYFDTIDKRSEAIAGKGQTMQSGFTGGSKTFDNGGLAYTFLQDFGKDPIAAVVRYNQGLEDMAAKEALLRRSEEQSFKNDLLLQQMEDMRLTSPNFNINITQDYGIDGTPQAPKVDIVPMMPNTINKTNGELSPYLSTSKAAQEDRIYETLPQMLKEAGLDVKVTSGYRKAGKAGKAGNMSWHPKHGAVDIVPQGNTTFEDIEKAVLTNPEIKSYMLTNGYGYLDETNRSKEGKTLMAKTGATGNHFHFGKDTSARNNYQRRINLHAFGGELGTNGTDFTNGLLYIDEGGSHEENPLEGVPMGVDPEGIPNLVEEGETVYNDYVFSDRMNVPDFMLKDLGLPKSKKGISFADASKKLAQESEKRPNDPISKDGLQVSLSRLAEIQETERMKKQAKEYTGLEKYACGGKMGRKYAGTGSQTNRLRSLGYDPFRFWDYNYLLANNPRAGRVVTSWTGSTNQENPNDFGKDKGEGYPSGIDIQIPNRIRIKPAPIDAPLVEPNIPDSIDMKPINVPKAKNYSPEVDSDDYTGLGEPKKYATWMRYAPVIGSGIMSLTDMLGLTNKPDYTYADKIAAAAGSAGYAPNVSYKPIGNYLRYNPMDIWFEQNRMDANARATDRAIQNNAAPIGTKIAGLLASGYNSQIADGQLYRNALEYNDAKRERVADFNRKTNMFNSQMGLEAAMANARYRQAAQQMGLSGLAQAAALRDQIDARVSAARSANLSNFLTSLGNIGRENFAMNQINTDRSRRYYGDLSGNAGGYKRKCGGKLKK